jgi:hypothetical protein
VGSSRVSAAIGARSAQLIRGTASEHGELVAQDQDLNLLGGIQPGTEHQPAHKLGGHLVDQPQRHWRIMPGVRQPRSSSRSPGASRVSGTYSVEPPVVGRCLFRRSTATSGRRTRISASFNRVGPGEHHKPAQHAAEHEVGESEAHRGPIMLIGEGRS